MKLNDIKTEPFCSDIIPAGDYVNLFLQNWQSIKSTRIEKNVHFPYKKVLKAFF